MNSLQPQRVDVGLIGLVISTAMTRTITKSVSGMVGTAVRPMMPWMAGTSTAVTANASIPARVDVGLIGLAMGIAMTRTIVRSVSGTVETVARVMMPSMAGTSSAVNANVLMSPARILGQLGFATETGSRTCATETG